MKPDNATDRVRVVKCRNDFQHHEGRLGWRLEGERVSIDEGEFMVMLEGGGDFLCVATEVEVQA